MRCERRRYQGFFRIEKIQPSAIGHKLTSGHEGQNRLTEIAGHTRGSPFAVHLGAPPFRGVKGIQRAGKSIASLIAIDSIFFIQPCASFSFFESTDACSKAVMAPKFLGLLISILSRLVMISENKDPLSANL